MRRHLGRRHQRRRPRRRRRRRRRTARSTDTQHTHRRARPPPPLFHEPYRLTCRRRLYPSLSRPLPNQNGVRWGAACGSAFGNVYT